MKWKGQICRIGALDLIATVSHGQNGAGNLSTAGSDSIRSLVQPNRAPLSWQLRDKSLKPFVVFFRHGALRKKLPRVVKVCRLIVIGPHLLWDSRRLKWWRRDAWEPQGRGPTTNLCLYLRPWVRKIQQLTWHGLVK